jgi:alpha-mannosidase
VVLIDTDQVHRRLARAMSEFVVPAIHPAAAPLDVARWDVPGEPVPVADGLAGPFRPSAVGEPWGPAWHTTWFRFTGVVPGDFAGHRVEARVDLGFTGAAPGFQAEGLAYRRDGSVLKSVQPRSQYVPVAASSRGGEHVEFFVEAAANPSPDLQPAAGYGLGAPDMPIYRLNRAELAVYDPEVFALHLDLAVLDELMTELPAGDARRYEVAEHLTRALDAVDLHDVNATAAAARAVLAPALAVPARASAHRADAVGSAHIDSAWLWPTRETVRKVARTVASVAALSEQYPELVFAFSQIQQMEWLKIHRPEVFALLKAKVASGHIVPVGGMWVEADGNLPSGEAWVRQLYYGKTFCRDEFGYDVTVGWLPDTFGFSPALPQLHKLAGLDSFATQKLCWNETNTMPHHTFWWEGTDGSRLFTHFHPVETSNSILSGREMLFTAHNFRDKGRANRSLTSFGHGDGGGGPTREMLERAHRWADLDGAPRVAITTPERFFAAARDEYTEAPVWVGEMYLEKHRGTFTTMVALKQGNRRNERLLREAELWCTVAAVHAGLEYPYAEFDALWKEFLLYQFHDILPGASINWVNREAVQGHAEITERLEAVLARALHALVAPGPGRTLFNADPYERDGVAALAAAPHEPATGGVTVRRDGAATVLDNGLLRVSVDPAGLVRSVLDHAADRELVAPGGAANLLQLHPDLPVQFDAWDLDSYYTGRVTDLDEAGGLEVDESDPDAPVVTVHRKFGASEVVQQLTLRAGARRLECTTDVEWQERDTVLKARFDLDVTAKVAQAEVAHGHVDRPTHVNTSWEQARYESYCHRFVRLAEPDYGVAVVNSGSYGYDVTRDVRADGGTTTVLRPTLLRGPRYPDPEADRGRHRFDYALVPSPTVLDAVRDGYRLGAPARVVDGVAQLAPLVAVDDPAIVVDAVKLAGDRSGDVVVRVYEALGTRATGTLTVGFPHAAAQVVDLLEEPVIDRSALADDDADGRRRLRLRPFQVVTIRLRRPR